MHLSGKYCSFVTASNKHPNSQSKQFCSFAKFIHAKVLHFHHFKFLDHSIFAVSAPNLQTFGSEHSFPPTRLAADEAGEAFTKPE